MGSIPFQLLPATFDDLDRLAEILVIAHENDATISNVMRDTPDELERKFYADDFRSMFRHEAGAKFFKVVEVETGKVVSMTCWHVPSAVSNVDHWGSLPTGANESLCKEFFGRLEVLEKKWLKQLGGGENIYFLHFISTLPDYQSKGLGGLCMSGMLKEADAVMKKVLLVGTPFASKSFYGRFGFEVVEVFAMDLKEYGIEGEGEWKVMVRDPQNQEK